MINKLLSLFLAAMFFTCVCLQSACFALSQKLVSNQINPVGVGIAVSRLSDEDVETIKKLADKYRMAIWTNLIDLESSIDSISMENQEQFIDFILNDIFDLVKNSDKFFTTVESAFIGRQDALYMTKLVQNTFGHYINNPLGAIQAIIQNMHGEMDQGNFDKKKNDMKEECSEARACIKQLCSLQEALLDRTDTHIDLKKSTFEEPLLTHAMFEEWAKQLQSKQIYDNNIMYENAAITPSGSVISITYFTKDKKWFVSFDNYSLFYVTAEGFILDPMNHYLYDHELAKMTIENFIAAMNSAVKESAKTQIRIEKAHQEHRGRVATAMADDAAMILRKGCVDEEPDLIRSHGIGIKDMDDLQLLRCLFVGYYPTVSDIGFELINENVLNEILKRNNYMEILNKALRHIELDLITLISTEVRTSSINLLDAAAKRASSEQAVRILKLKEFFLSCQLDWQFAGGINPVTLARLNLNEILL